MPPLKRHPNEPLIRFRRELNGTKYKFKPPQPPMLPRHRIDDLEPTLNIRLYTILGEQTTYPHHLITLRKLPSSVLLATSGLPVHFSSPTYFSHLDLPAAEITYWSLSPSLQLTIAHTTQHRAPEHSHDLQLAYTAWQNSCSQPLQVLAWSQRYWSPRLRADFPPDELPITFEFRAGGQSVQTECIIPMAEEGINVCFAGVAVGEESTVKMLHAGVLYLYEPCAGSLPALPDTAAWRTLRPGSDITVAYDPTDTGVVTSPRVRTCDLRVLAKQFLGVCHKIPELKDGKQPVFSGLRCVLVPTKRVARTKPGAFGVHAKTLIAFGAAEMVTDMYHLLVFSLQLPCPGRHPRVQVAIAKAYGGLQGKEAFTIALRKCGIYVAAQGHDCEKGCSNDEVGVRKTFELGATGLNEIRCEGLGITIEGWGGEIARAPGEQEAARRVWEVERTIERMRMGVSFPD